MIRLVYFNNVHREDIGEISLESLKEKEKIIEVILQKFQDSGRMRKQEIGKLCVRQNEKWYPLDENIVLQDGDTIFYFEILPLNNAQEYDRQNGIVFFFHSSEKGHLRYPHIHARYAGDEISIYFRNLHVVGKMKNKSKQREAVAYVRSHMSDLQNEWKHIMAGGK